MTTHLAGKTFLRSDIITSVPGLTPVQEVGTKADFSTLFDGCIDPGTGDPLTFNDLQLETEHLDKDEPYIAYDYVEPSFPLWIDTHRSGKRNVIYDLYFYNGPLFYCYSSNYGDCQEIDRDLPNQFCLKIIKNYCEVYPYQLASKSNLYPDSQRCLFLYTFHDYNDKYYMIPTSFIRRGNMSNAVIKNDIAEYEFEIPHPQDGETLKKIILEIALKDERHYITQYIHIAFDADKLKTASSK